MKNLVLKTKYVVLALLISFSYSYSTEDGADGVNGADGIAGPQGQQGIPGTNGNANVQTLTFDASSFSGSSELIYIPELTQDVVDNDAIISYLKDSGTNWVSVPCPYDTYQFDFSVHVTINNGSMDFDFGDASGSNFSINAGDLESLKVIIIESSSSKISNTTTKQHVFNELYQAGIDINDYYAVCDYYGISY